MEFLNWIVTEGVVALMTIVQMRIGVSTSWRGTNASQEVNFSPIVLSLDLKIVYQIVKNLGNGLDLQMKSTSRFAWQFTLLIKTNGITPSVCSKMAFFKRAWHKMKVL